jgi:hypothetical protein
MKIINGKKHYCNCDHPKAWAICLLDLKLKPKFKDFEEKRCQVCGLFYFCFEDNILFKDDQETKEEIFEEYLRRNK